MGGRRGSAHQLGAGHRARSRLGEAHRRHLDHGRSSTAGGNVTATAEFNIYADPAAAARVFPSGADIVMYGLNLTHQVQTNDALVADLRASGAPLARFASQVFDFLHGVSPTSSPQSERDDQEIDSASLTFPELLAAVESRSATREKMESFVDVLFDGLQERVSSDDFSDFFEMDFEEHPDFVEESTEGFIIKVLSTEYRSDGFVTAEKQYNRVSSIFGLYAWRGDQGYRESFNLRLNCHMKRAQLKLTMTPRFHSLKQLTLVVTCAPSLEHCYVFVVVCEHSP